MGRLEIGAAELGVLAKMMRAVEFFTLLASDFQFVLQENPAAASEMRSIANQRRFASSHAR